MTKKNQWLKYVALVTVVAIIGIGAYFLYRSQPNQNGKIEKIRVGYPPVSTSLPLFVAIDQKIFGEKGLEVEPIRFETANQVVEALVAGRIDATSVCADYPILSIANQSPDSFKIYAWSMLDTEIPMDLVLSKKGSPIRELKDLQGKKIATFPGSQLKHYINLIMQKALNETPNIEVIEMPPQNQIPALESGSVDAIFCLEPIGTIALEKGIGQIVARSPISTYIGEGSPIPAASFAISNDFVKKYPDESRKFVNAMWLAIDKINSNQNEYKYLLPTFSPITPEIAPKVFVTKFSKAPEMNIQLFQKEANILFDAKLLEKQIDVSNLVYK